MKQYLTWNEQTISEFVPEQLDAMYDRGYVFTRPAEGLMQQTRSIRVDLSLFELRSENRRIVRKTEGLHVTRHSLPVTNYSWTIGKMGKEFYEQKFGDGTFSANKIKELLTSGRKDFTTLLAYTYEGETVGYAICVETPTLLHYSYPFYDLTPNLQSPISNIGMGMMIRAVEYAKEAEKQYCYLGSAQRPGDIYKLQFAGLEWFDGTAWQTDLDILKRIITHDI